MATLPPYRWHPAGTRPARPWRKAKIDLYLLGDFRLDLSPNPSPPPQRLRQSKDGGRRRGEPRTAGNLPANAHQPLPQVSDLIEQSASAGGTAPPRGQS